MCTDTVRKWRRRFRRRPAGRAEGRPAQRAPAGVHRCGPGRGRRARRAPCRPSPACRCRGGAARNWPANSPTRCQVAASASTIGPVAGRRCPQALAAPVLDLRPATPNSPTRPPAGCSTCTPGIWDGRNRSGSNDYVICADEKTSIQARCRCHPHPAAGQGPRDARRARLPARRRPGLPGRLGRPPRAGQSAGASTPPASPRSPGWSNK